MDVHLDLEKKIAEFFGTEQAILYAQGYAAVASVIPAFSKRGDIIVYDEAVNYAVMSGIKVSKSYAYAFRHNDCKDLELILQEIEQKYSDHKQSRRFIVVESLYSYTGKICDIKKIIELKKKYKFRLIVDNSVALGGNGANGLGGLPNAREVTFIFSKYFF